MEQKTLPQPGRHNMYYGIHKGLRLGHTRLLERLSVTDFTDAAATQTALAELRRFLDLAEGHLHSEEGKIHPKVEARAPGATAHADEGHEHHEQAFVELEDLACRVESASAAERPVAGQALYLRYARFAGDDFVHMEGEETELLGALQLLFTDDELRAIEGEILGAIPPGRMDGYTRLIVAALSRPERIGMLSEMRAAMPAEVFAGVLAQSVRPALAAEDWADLARALDLRIAA